jgi:MFS transporter, NNP family, nitrate/nitrite transporter
VALILFSRMTVLPFAIVAMILFSLCVQMAEGATFSVVPFINKRALGSVAGIVGAGGNAGAVAAGFLFRSPDLSWPTAFLILGFGVSGISTLSLVVRFSAEHEASARREVVERLSGVPVGAKA